MSDEVPDDNLGCVFLLSLGLESSVTDDNIVLASLPSLGLETILMWHVVTILVFFLSDFHIVFFLSLGL